MATAMTPPATGRVPLRGDRYAGLKGLIFAEMKVLYAAFLPEATSITNRPGAVSKGITIA